MSSFDEGIIRPSKQDNSLIKVFLKLQADSDLILLNNIRSGQYIYCSVPVFIDNGGIGQIIPSIYTATTESDFMATVSGQLKRYGTSVRYIGYVSHKALGWSQLWLYKIGNEFAGITGEYVQGFTSGASGTLSKESDHLAITINTGGADISYRPFNKIDLTNISTLFFDWEAIASGTYDTRSQIRVTTDSAGINVIAQYISPEDNSGFSRVEQSLDVISWAGVTTFI